MATSEAKEIKKQETLVRFSIISYKTRLRVPVQYMKTTSSEHVVHTNCVFVLTFRTIYAHNMFSPCSEFGLTKNCLYENDLVLQQE